MRQMFYFDTNDQKLTMLSIFHYLTKYSVFFFNRERENDKKLTLYSIKFLLVSNEILDQCSCVCVRLVSLFPEIPGNH